MLPLPASQPWVTRFPSSSLREEHTDKVTPGLEHRFLHPNVPAPAASLPVGNVRTDWALGLHGRSYLCLTLAELPSKATGWATCMDTVIFSLPCCSYLYKRLRRVPACLSGHMTHEKNRIWLLSPYGPTFFVPPFSGCHSEHRTDAFSSHAPSTH